MTSESIIEVNILEKVLEMPYLERKEFMESNPYPNLIEKMKIHFKEEGFEFLEMKNAEIMIFRKIPELVAISRHPESDDTISHGDIFIFKK